MDAESVLKSLNAHRVRYVVIGAAAFPAHRYVRVTLDIDILIDATPANAGRTLEALREAGYDVSDISQEELLTKKLLIRQYIQETDIHPSAVGVEFEDVWRHRVRGKIGGTAANIASLDDLIAMKRAAGRPKDLEDLRVLLRLKEKRSKTPGGKSA